MTYYNNTRQNFPINRSKEYKLTTPFINSVGLLTTDNTVEDVQILLNSLIESYLVTAPNRTGYATSTEN